MQHSTRSIRWHRLSRGSRRTLTIGLVAAVLSLCVASSIASAQAGAAASTPSPTLYEQLGRYDGVQAFVALVFPRVAQHPDLRRMFQGHGADSQQKQFQHVVELICNRAGGPCVYTGREMRTVHVGLGISSGDWDVFMRIIDDGLAESNYPTGVRAEFRKLWESFRDGVVEARAP